MTTERFQDEPATEIRDAAGNYVPGAGGVTLTKKERERSARRFEAIREFYRTGDKTALRELGLVPPAEDQ